MAPIAAAIAIAIAMGCAAPGAGDSTFPADPYVTLTGVQGHLIAEVRTSPSQPPTRGMCSVELVVTTVTGTPQDGLTIEATPWMPKTADGASVHPRVTPQGEGHYRLDDVAFEESGEWQLRTTFFGLLSDEITPVFQVQ